MSPIPPLPNAAADPPGIDAGVWEAAAAALQSVARGQARLLVGAGAGMGVDSGLPDFRGTEGFWRAYPPFAALGLGFEDLANPRWFEDDPALAWGFYGHRLHLYRDTTPHPGFAILKELAAQSAGSLVFTSNVDGQFHRAGFDPATIVEVHGSIHHLQCSRGCGQPPTIWPADGVRVAVDPSTFRAAEPLPRCRCGALARPNILMFGDWHWDESRSEAQQRGLMRFLQDDSTPIVAVEVGAGTAIPTVRRFSEQVLRKPGCALLRLNVRESQGPSGTLSFPAPAAATLQALARRLAGD